MGLRVRRGGFVVGYVQRLRLLALLLLSCLRDSFFFFLVCVTMMLGKDKIILYKIFKGLGFLCWVKLVNWTYFVLNLLLVIFVIVLIFWAYIFCFRF